jgi:hypothetical protein
MINAQFSMSALSSDHCALIIDHCERWLYAYWFASVARSL